MMSGLKGLVGFVWLEGCPLEEGKRESDEEEGEEEHLEQS